MSRKPKIKALNAMFAIYEYKHRKASENYWFYSIWLNGSLFDGWGSAVES
jgi:hypothetical protein